VSPGHWSTTFAGKINVGGVVSITVIVWSAVATLPQPSAALQVRERDFVQAMRAVGARDGYIMWRHIVPNCLASVAVQVSLSFVEAVRTEATLSFLGLGVPPPAPSWGNMLDDGRVFLQTAPWMILFPAGALALTILGTSLLGDGLRDALDPKLRSH